MQKDWQQGGKYYKGTVDVVPPPVVVALPNRAERRRREAAAKAVESQKRQMLLERNLQQRAMRIRMRKASAQQVAHVDRLVKGVKAGRPVVVKKGR